MKFFKDFLPKCFPKIESMHSHQAVESASAVQFFLCYPCATFQLTPSRKAPLFLPESKLWLCHVNTYLHLTMALCVCVYIFMCKKIAISAFGGLWYSPHRQPSTIAGSGYDRYHLFMPESSWWNHISVAFLSFFKDSTVFLKLTNLG